MEGYKYKCEICGYKYKEEEWAKKCQDWCKKTNSCNLEIISHGISGEEKENADKNQCCN